jgi:flagellar basal-body rod protein FlgG
MDAQQTRMDTIANNLANASTTGFKKSRADFEDLMSETIRAPQQIDPRGGTQRAHRLDDAQLQPGRPLADRQPT